MRPDAWSPRASSICTRTTAEVSGRPLLFNVVQAYDDKPQIHRRALRWLESCRRRGIRVYGQGLTTDAGYSFSFENWNLFDECPAWRDVTVGTPEEKLAKLADPARRPALRARLPSLVLGPFENIVVTGPVTPATQQWLDHTIGLIAEKTGKHPADALLDIVVADGLRTDFLSMPSNQSLVHLKEIVDNPYVLLGVSDGGAHTKFLTAGRYPIETLIKIVRDHDMLSLEEAHWRLSALPAQLAGFTDRGVIKLGVPADLVVYDLEQLEILPPQVVHDLPGGADRLIADARGIDAVIVNGRLLRRDNRDVIAPDGPLPGQVLRNGRGASPINH